MTRTPKHAEIVIIGGGIIGCSTAYHLAKDHGADVVLLEAGKLTGGSTWHAAGLVGQLRSSEAITQVLKYSVDLYTKLGAETGLETGWKMTGCLRLACTEARLNDFRRTAEQATQFGMEMDILSAREAQDMAPFLETSDLVGASWLPTDGQASPSDIAQSLAKGARMHGARLVEDMAVTGLTLEGNRIRSVQTSTGRIDCETVINCAGLWAQKIGAMAEVAVPLLPIKHQYVLTEPMGLPSNTPTLRDPDRRTYFKEEVGGLSFGGYEPNPIACPSDVVDPTPFRLFDDDWDHFGQHLEQAMHRIPALQDTGVRQMINGAESFTPDGNCLMGNPVGPENFYIGAGFNAFGIASAGGAGWVLAEWARTGRPPMDLSVVDIRRFGTSFENPTHVAAQTLAAYADHYALPAELPTAS
jgi:4-methylaminobutanoate oxidase (formaldehyde-forming)